MKTRLLVIFLFLWAWTGLFAQIDTDQPCPSVSRFNPFSYHFPKTDTEFDKENRTDFEEDLIRLVKARRIDIIGYVTDGKGKRTPGKVAHDRATMVLNILKEEGYPGVEMRSFILACPGNQCPDLEIRTCPTAAAPVVNLRDSMVVHSSGLGFVVPANLAKAVTWWQVQFFPDSTGVSTYIDHRQIYWEQALRFHLEIPENRVEDAQKVMIPLVQNTKQKELTLAKYDAENQIWIELKPSIKLTHAHEVWLSAPLQGSGLYALQYQVKKKVQRIGLVAPAGLGFVAGQWWTTNPKQSWNASISMDQRHMDLVGIDLNVASDWNIQLADPLGRMYAVSTDHIQQKIREALAENTTTQGPILRLHKDDLHPLNP